MRCPSCRRLMTIPNRTASQVPDSNPGSAIPSTPLPLPAVSAVSQPPFSMQPNKYSNNSISNDAIILTAVSCLFGLILVVGSAILWMSLTKIPPKPTVELVQEEGGSTKERTEFQEGYSIVLPAGFKQESREETERGDIVYRFRSDEGYRFTLAIIPDESIDRFTNPPQSLSEALVKSVPELSEGFDVEIQPMRITADRMRATVFFYYEKETYRGVTFTYVMVAMDRGRKLVLKIAGKYGGYHEQDENINLPDHWHDSLLTLRHVRRLEKPNETLQP